MTRNEAIKKIYELVQTQSWVDLDKAFEIASEHDIFIAEGDDCIIVEDDVICLDK